MRSTPATAAVARLNNRKEHYYAMAQTGAGLFYLSERIDGSDERVSGALPLDDFVRFLERPFWVYCVEKLRFISSVVSV